MNSNDLIHEARVPAVAACAHIAAKRNDDATTVLRFFLLDKVDEGIPVPTVLDALVKATLTLCVHVAGDDPEVFQEIAAGMAAEVD